MFASNGLKENTRRKKRGIERGEKREREYQTKHAANPLERLD